MQFRVYLWHLFNVLLFFKFVYWHTLIHVLFQCWITKTHARGHETRAYDRSIRYVRLDSHADIGVLTKRWLDNALFFLLFTHHPFFTNQRSVLKRRCLHEDPALVDMTDFITWKVANFNISLRRAERRFLLPDSFVLRKNASNEYIFITIT